MIKQMFWIGIMSLSGENGLHTKQIYVWNEMEAQSAEAWSRNMADRPSDIAHAWAKRQHFISLFLREMLVTNLQIWFYMFKITNGVNLSIWNLQFPIQSWRTDQSKIVDCRDATDALTGVHRRLQRAPCCHQWTPKGPKWVI